MADAVLTGTKPGIRWCCTNIIFALRRNYNREETIEPVSKIPKTHLPKTYIDIFWYSTGCLHHGFKRYFKMMKKYCSVYNALRTRNLGYVSERCLKVYDTFPHNLLVKGLRTETPAVFWNTLVFSKIKNGLFHWFKTEFHGFKTEILGAMSFIKTEKFFLSQ